MIYRFTNSHRAEAFGLIVEETERGAWILLDEFEPKEGVILPVRYRYISRHRSPVVQRPGRAARLQLDAPVIWKAPIMNKFLRQMKGGILDIEEVEQYI